MQNAFSKIYLQIVIGVKSPQYHLPESICPELEKFIMKVIERKNADPIAINCRPDHTHLFIGVKPIQSITNIVDEIQRASSELINNRSLFNGKFSWEDNFGAFSYCNSQYDKIVSYVTNQDQEHLRKTYKDKYTEILEKTVIEYEKAYIFEN